jgi:uncharacterized protein GlcG (DUF336 family)
MSLSLAEQLLAKAKHEAESRGVAMGIAVVDIGGNLVAALRMDNAQVIALSLAVDKAYTSVACGRPSDAWGESTQPGGLDWGFNTALGGRIIVIAGGLPVWYDGQLIGGLGVSGAAAAVDRACAEAGILGAGLSVDPG